MKSFSFRSSKRRRRDDQLRLYFGPGFFVKLSTRQRRRTDANGVFSFVSDFVAAHGVSSGSARNYRAVYRNNTGQYENTNRENNALTIISVRTAIRRIVSARSTSRNYYVVFNVPTTVTWPVLCERTSVGRVRVCRRLERYS